MHLVFEIFNFDFAHLLIQYIYICSSNKGFFLFIRLCKVLDSLLISESNFMSFWIQVPNIFILNYRIFLLIFDNQIQELLSIYFGIKNIIEIKLNKKPKKCTFDQSALPMHLFY